jgi:hypothetical protein
MRPGAPCVVAVLAAVAVAVTVVADGAMHSLVADVVMPQTVPPLSTPDSPRTVDAAAGRRPLMLVASVVEAHRKLVLVVVLVAVKQWVSAVADLYPARCRPVRLHRRRRCVAHAGWASATHVFPCAPVHECMRSGVRCAHLQIALGRESTSAHVTAKRFVASVCAHVYLQSTAAREVFVAHATLVFAENWRFAWRRWFRARPHFCNRFKR